MQSLALGILGHDQADVGKLFGALSMLSSVSSTILSVGAPQVDYYARGLIFALAVDFWIVIFAYGCCVPPGDIYYRDGGVDGCATFACACAAFETVEKTRCRGFPA